MAKQIRRDSLRMVHIAGSGHVGGAMGAAEIFAVLYGSILRWNSPTRPTDGPDRFVLSNGHICAGWYAALSLSGIISRSELESHRKMGSRLQGHPSRQKFPDAVETSTGPLGQGVSVATGIALGMKMRQQPGRVFCLVGDGELQEGIVWESSLTAAHFALNNLCLIISDNNIQIDGHTSEVKKVHPIDEKFQSFGWNTLTVDGHDISQLYRVIQEASNNQERPTCIVASTIIGKGVPKMEDDPKWHGSCPSERELTEALETLGYAKTWKDF
jgi:transketolase